MSRRDQIRMSAVELAGFLDEERTVVCATIGRDGFPHLMPLWYAMRGDELWSWTFAKSQKVRNLEREARATLVVEAGAAYEELRGAMLKCDVTLHRDLALVMQLGRELLVRYGARTDGELEEEVEAMVRRQAPKRVALQFRARSAATWDHRKLSAGVY